MQVALSAKDFIWNDRWPEYGNEIQFTTHQADSVQDIVIRYSMHHHIRTTRSKFLMSRLISDQGYEMINEGRSDPLFLFELDPPTAQLLRGADTFQSPASRCVIALKESVDVSFVTPSQSALIKDAILCTVIQYIADPIHSISSVCIPTFLHKQKQCLDYLIDTRSGCALDVDLAGTARPCLECLIRVVGWGRILELCFRRPRLRGLGCATGCQISCRDLFERMR
jgi:hypothetical protein